MSKKEFILDQLDVCRNMGSWIQPLNSAVDGLELVHVIWRENEASHTICEIVNHLLFWNSRWLNRFKGETKKEEPIQDKDNALTFKINDMSEEKWHSLVFRLDNVLAQWQETIKDCSESKLYEAIPNFPDGAKWWEALSNLCTHNAYHIGQIIYIRKSQGSWKANMVKNEISPNFECG